MRLQPSARVPRSARSISALGIAAAVAAIATGCFSVPESLPPPESISHGRLPRLADVFYQRIANRRFNSIATFHDPALREFFATAEAFADYYADLAQAFDAARFEANRPLRITLLEFEPNDLDRVLIHVHFTGENARPLRWWSSKLVRSDQWEFMDGRWVIHPGKL